MKAQKQRGRGKIVSSLTVFLFTPVLILLSSSLAQAVDVEFWSDATIEDGDVYDIVSVYDTPPNMTTVDMFGGNVGSLRTYDSSIANIYFGEVFGEIRTANSSNVNIYGGSVTCHFLAVGDSSTLNVYGGNFSSTNSPGFSEASTVNIYGYDFSYDGWSLTGFLQDGSPLIFTELSPSNYAHINLIPEPSSLLLFGLGVLLLRKLR